MESFSDLLKRQRDFFQSGKTKDVSYRIEALTTLGNMVRSNETELMAALKKDLNKSDFDSYISEMGILLEEIRFTLKHIKDWTQPRRVKTAFTQMGSKGYIYSEPYGVALIISPWNYPLQLAIAPLIGAIAAGNCAILKPSELTPETSKLIADLITKTFPAEYISVVQGDAETTQSLLKEKFDYIFFTGSVAVGKVIMEAAAKHLTPVTLELGGKSPCIVHHDANIKLAAKRIAWGKFINAGQTCVAPDYLYVHRDVKDEFIRMFIESIKEIYEEIVKNGEFTRIVSEKHFNRVTGFLTSGEILHGGNYSIDTLTLEPTVIGGVNWDDPVMQEEIFGPILPILDYDDIQTMVGKINEQPKPLALYIFSESKEFQATILNSISFGGGCINDTVMHLSSPYLPFGGVGESGIGAYHGRGSFDVFSHQKSILKQTTTFDLPFRYPNRKDALKQIKLFIK
ncbi:aldehyde dehydrogenase (NAD+) [Neobacillus niacini]|uniref:aldehyde dehydrogenase n=1 Tax=Neobacillus niacini TaxID=86668 RepID=UPI00285D3764|nr:aldehyde dehydrogenase [Neobacillus niacini]MDR7078258.1 aldehyde dehydrogenase (NAD+) [Neobacillus niacini]